jgi:phospholipid transport system substrate-binding protein
MTRPTRRAFLPLLAAAVSCGFQATARDGDDRIEQPVELLYKSLETVMRSGRATPFQQRFDAVAPAIERAFDLDTILKVSVGLRWDGIDPQTRGKLSAAFRRFTIATYVANFDKYDGEAFKVLPETRDSGTDRIVRTEIVAAAGDPVRIDYVMRDTGGSWRAVDVLLDGSISRVAVQRSDFRKILSGGDAHALIVSLHRKVADLSGGALSS